MACRTSPDQSITQCIIFEHQKRTRVDRGDLNTVLEKAEDRTSVAYSESSAGQRVRGAMLMSWRPSGRVIVRALTTFRRSLAA